MSDKIIEGGEVDAATRRVRTGSRAGHPDGPVEDIVITQAEIV